MAPLLITSFAPWKAHQTSNSSDDLLEKLHQQGGVPSNVVWLRQIPVNYQLAPCQVIAKLVELQPAVLVCCGMAEKRQQLSLELNGRWEDQLLKTTLNLSDLLEGTRFTEISPCAGTYVCNHLYFKVLEFIQRSRSSTQALFIHVPRLTPLNEAFVTADFALVLERLSRVGQVLQQAA